MMRNWEGLVDFVMNTPSYITFSTNLPIQAFLIFVCNVEILGRPMFKTVLKLLLDITQVTSIVHAAKVPQWREQALTMSGRLVEILSVKEHHNAVLS